MLTITCKSCFNLGHFYRLRWFGYWHHFDFRSTLDICLESWHWNEGMQ